MYSNATRVRSLVPELMSYQDSQRLLDPQSLGVRGATTSQVNLFPVNQILIRSKYNLYIP